MSDARNVEIEARRQVAALFAGVPAHRGAPPRIGIEAELLVFGGDRGGASVVAIERLASILFADAAFTERARISFEPGGQVELSPEPQPTVALASSKAIALVADLSARLQRGRIRVEAVGVDRRRAADDVGLQLQRDRYIVMQRHFDAIGPAGRRMMRQTASLQICIDQARGRDGARQWLAANMIGPSLAAALRTTAGADNRTSIWLDVDPSRTGLDGRQVDAHRPADAYHAFALGAEVMPLPRAGRLAPDRVPFARWAASTDPAPDAADVAHHLSTLFPPVRPRGRYLEVRYLDAQPIARMETAIVLLAIILADPTACDAALEIVGADPVSLAAAWRRSAAYGLADPSLRRAARDLVVLASTRIAPLDSRWPGWLPPSAPATLERFADDVADGHDLARAS